MKKILILIVVLSFSTILLSACGIVRGSGDVVTVIRDVSDFDQVALSGVGTLFVTVGETESLKIEAEDNLFPYIETRVRGNTLDIGFSRDRWNMAIQPTQPIYYYLTVTDLEGLELSGAGNIEIDELETPQLRVVTSGAGNIEINRLITEQFLVDVSGAGSCRIHDGEVQNQELRISGAGGYRASDFKSQTTAIDISGMGGADVWVEKTLNVTISGAGNVEYFGQPSVSQDVSGLGNINSLGIKD
jgi:predicted small secreted protein